MEDDSPHRGYILSLHLPEFGLILLLYRNTKSREKEMFYAKPEPFLCVKSWI